MRRRLLLVVLATTGLVVVAFAIPLGALVRAVAHDRAVAAAERDAGSLAPVLALDPSPSTVTAALGGTATGADGRLAVWLPDGTAVGEPAPSDEDPVALARQQRRSFPRARGGGLDLYTAVVTGSDEVAVVRATVPESMMQEGVGTAWLALAGVAVVLVGAAAVIADRLARSVTRDASELSATARALAAGRGDARADPGTTPELADAARALNLLADRIDELRAVERERVADLSHRLRTPLTAARLDAEAAGEPALVADVDRLEAAVSELIRSARRPLHAGPVAASCDLAAVAQERARFWSALAEDDGRPWTLDGHAGGGTGSGAGSGSARRPVPVGLSADEAGAAIDALVGNVFAHTGEGTAYALRLDVAGGRARLAVEDGGPGIDTPDRALDRGATSAGSRSTGLGLDIARQAAEAAGGELSVDRSPALGGARVVLSLPVLADR